MSEAIPAAIETLKHGAPGIEAAETAAALTAWNAAHPDDGTGACS